jgi:PKD repeat protein
VTLTVANDGGSDTETKTEIIIVGPTSRVFYLHGEGAYANPATLSVDDTQPIDPTAKYKDSPSVNFSRGNPWAEAGTWTVTPAFWFGELISLTDLHVWLGLKNSDDQGTAFDVQAELYKNGVLVATGLSRNVTGITRNPSLAKEAAVPFDSFAPTMLDGATDVLTLKLLARIGTHPDGTKAPGHANAVGLRLYFDAPSRPAAFTAQF